jgi:hypothetical protein
MFESEVDFGESASFSSEPHVLPFKAGYFVVDEDDGGPSLVVKPNGPTVCKFKRTFTPRSRRGSRTRDLQESGHRSHVRESTAPQAAGPRR